MNYEYLLEKNYQGKVPTINTIFSNEIMPNDKDDMQFVIIKYYEQIAAQNCPYIFKELNKSIKKQEYEKEDIIIKCTYPKKNEELKKKENFQQIIGVYSEPLD